MKLRKFFISAVILVCVGSLVACGLLFKNYDDPDCGLYLDVDVPRGADSIKVSFHNDGSVNLFFKATFCDACRDDAEGVMFDKTSEELKGIDGWRFGKFYMDEIAYYGLDSVVFPTLEINVKKDKFAYLGVKADSSSYQHYTPFIPVTKNVVVDSSYRYDILDNYRCFEGFAWE